MILNCRPDSIHNFKEFVRKIVDQENAYGDNLRYDRLLISLTSGMQNMVLIYDDKDLDNPVLVLIVRDLRDPIRDQRHLIIDNILVPDKEKLAGYGASEDRERFLAYCKPFDKVYFWTRNEAILDLVEQLGIFFDPTFIMFELRR